MHVCTHGTELNIFPKVKCALEKYGRIYIYLVLFFLSKNVFLYRNYRFFRLVYNFPILDNSTF
jgi:hypothetical protein